MGGHFLWVSGGGWGWVEVYFGRVGVGELFLCVSGGGWGGGGIFWVGRDG